MAADSLSNDMFKPNRNHIMNQNSSDCRRPRPWAALLSGLLLFTTSALTYTNAQEPEAPEPPAAPAATEQAWAPAEGPLMTRWAKDVSPENAHPEYPRPQMVRQQWLNLNGLWQFEIVEREADRPAAFNGQILVPFPIESALSGVKQTVSPEQRLWYRRSFCLPEDWAGQRVVLHFGAVDWEATVYVNGTEIGAHRGGYDAFSFDITDALKPDCEQELVVAVWDPTDGGYQPRGKQIRNPHGIWYTPTTGIWQTAWLEPVAEGSIKTLKLTPDLDASKLNIQATARKATAGARLIAKASVQLKDGKTVEAKAEAEADENGVFNLAITVPEDGVLWTPEHPALHDLNLTVQVEDQVIDQIASYFGMRKIALGKDEAGIQRLMLNNKPVFQFGPLDQGFWPDGLYTAPTDEALRYDIEMTKKLGFNMARKHVKIEPARWYYWCDKLGLLVWQDMPSGDRYIGSRDPDIERTPESAQQFEAELKSLIDGLGNHPSIVMWVPYNEGWGQWDTERIAKWTKEYDPTRLVNSASGWTDRGVGDVHDIHSYPGPSVPAKEENRAVVLGEYGGLGFPIAGHTWQDESNWGYRSYEHEDDLTEAYLRLTRELRKLTGERGLAAAVYTQTTDVEIEVNGLMTYDRELVKMDLETIAAANATVYTPPAPRNTDRFIPPATPLVATDPYFSIWSFADKLTDEPTRHWTGTEQNLTGMVKIDGQPFRIMGAEPGRIPALSQTGLVVHPTNTIYTFEGQGVRVRLSFTTAMLPEDLELLSRSLTYLTWNVSAIDGNEHEVSLYFDNTAELVVNEPSQQVVWDREEVDGLNVLKFGSKDQPVLAKKGDNLRIDWGYLYTAAPSEFAPQSAITSLREARAAFLDGSPLTGADEGTMPRPANAQTPVAAFAFDLGTVGKTTVSRWLMLAYDDLYSIQYFRKNLRPFWARNGATGKDLLASAFAEYGNLMARCRKFDRELMTDLSLTRGQDFARVAALAFRQAFAANKFVADANGQPLSFSKENFSNGCIGTSDVFYPMAPLFIFFGPSATKSILVPMLEYASSERWKFPFAPHDIGTYPKANGQVYGGGETSEENQMPVEETGNMLILMAVVAEMDGNADFAADYWPLLQTWANYLVEKGFDPENQLCTDDFAGHLAHNVNLSAKAICGLASYARLCEMRGEKEEARKFMDTAREFARKWMETADNGDHYRLAFDRPDTWSQKYNLVWDNILGFNLFPESVKQKEMAYYKTVQNKYGLPLDNRRDYTKLDWIIWTATLTNNHNDFNDLFQPVVKFLMESPDRVPMSDWYDTKTGKVVGFRARPVVGGVFLPMLYDRVVWKKWADRDRIKADDWAGFPKQPTIVNVVPSAQNEKVAWRYTTERPRGEWFSPEFDDSEWKTGEAGFGTANTPSAVVGTVWDSNTIWLRREFELANKPTGQLHLWIHHDEDAEVYINGVQAASLGGFSTSYEEIPLPPDAFDALRQGKNTLAIRCRQTSGGQYIDAGLVQVIPAED